MNITDATLLTEIEQTLIDAGLTDGDTLSIAYSGGPDSTALLYLLKQLQKKFGFSLNLAYVEHGLRPRTERSEELRRVISTASQLRTPLYILFLPPGLLAQEHGGTEAAARRQRYRFFRRLRGITGSRFTILGHTLDDRTETLLMRFFQGSGVDGLTGMKPVDPPLIRPLLGIRKGELLSFLTERNITYSRDSSNQSIDYLRNKIRHRLLPTIREIFPNIDSSLGLLGEKMTAAAELLQRNAPDEIELDRNRGIGRYDHDGFFRLPLHFRVQLIYSLYDHWYGESGGRLPYRFVKELCSEASAKRRHFYGSGHGIGMEKSGSDLFWLMDIVPSVKKRYLKIVRAGTLFLPDGSESVVEVCADTEDASNRADAEGEGGGLHLKSAEEFLPLVMRNIRDGDRINLRGGSKKIRDLLSGHGFLREKSKETAVFEDRRGILAIVQPSTPFFIRKSALLDTQAEDAIIYKIEFLEAF